MRVASFEEPVGEVSSGSGDVLGGAWDVEVVSDLREEVAVENTRLVGQDVIPHLRDLWADQPDRWTPEATHLAPVAKAAPRKKPAAVKKALAKRRVAKGKTKTKPKKK